MTLTVRKLAAPAGALVLAAGIGVASAGIPSGGGKIFGCYAKKGGVLRVVSEGQKCKKSEHALFWNQQGPPGDSGPQASKGPQGPRGLTGPQGPKGDKGLKGDTGAKGPKGDAGPKGAKGDSGAKGDQGDAGPKGAKGDTGPKGDPGIAQVTTRTNQLLVGANKQGWGSVDCLPGEVVLGGGYETNDALVVKSSEPSATGWTVYFSNPSASYAIGTVLVRCAQL